MTNKKKRALPLTRHDVAAGEPDIKSSPGRAAAAAVPPPRTPALDPAGQTNEIADGQWLHLPPDEHNSLQIYLHEIARVPLLTPAQEVDLAARIKAGDESARQQMISANLLFVVKIAHEYSHFGLPLLDLISEGNIGLMKAVERFDPAKGGKLSTYAVWWIKQSIKRALANQGKTIRLPVHMVDKIAKLRKAARQMQETLGRDPTNEELAGELGLPVWKIAQLKTVSARPTSLDAPVSEGDPTELGELVCDENEPTPFETFLGKTSRQDITSIVSNLEPRETQLMRLRFGLDGERPKTLEEVAVCLRVTRERVRQLQNTAMSKMRVALNDLEHQNTAEEAKEELSPTDEAPAKPAAPARRPPDQAELYAFMRSQREPPGRTPRLL